MTDRIANIQVIDLSNIKYAVDVEGGGWNYEHTLYLITNDGCVYATDEWKNEDIIPGKSAEACYLGKIDANKSFVVPEHPNRCVCDAPNVMVFDSSLSKPIYDAYGVEEEFKTYFDAVFNLKHLQNCFKLQYVKNKSWHDDNASYTAYYRCPLTGIDNFEIDFDCTPGFGEVNAGFTNSNCRKCCEFVRNYLDVSIKQIYPCPYINNK